MKKRCCRCKKQVLLEFFGKSSKSPDGLRSECKPCRSKEYKERRGLRKEYFLKKEQERRIRNRESIRLSNKKYSKKTKMKRFAYFLERKYGINIKDYDRMFEEQNGKCDICKKDQDTFDRRLCVDHCHRTGVVRGLLCDKCNRLIGQANDNIDILNNSIEYLKKHSKG